MASRAPLRILFTVAKDPRLIMAVGLVLGSFFVYLTVRGIDWAEVRAQIAGTSPAMLLLALAGVLLSAFLRAARWRLLFVEERVRLRRLFTVEMAALGLNNISPVRLLDEPAILTLLSVRDKLPAPTIVATVLMSRVQDIAMSLSIIAAAVAFEPDIAERAGAAALVVGLLVVALVLLLSSGRIARRVRIVGRIPGVLAYGAAVDGVMSRRARLLGSSTLTVVYSLMLGPAAWALAHGMGVEINLFQATVVVLGALVFATTVPGLPGAFGAFELAVQAILELWGVPRELGFGYGVMLHLCLFLPPIAFAVVILPREGVGLLQSWRSIVSAPPQSPSGPHTS